MQNTYSLIGPNMFMDPAGKTFTKTASGEFVPIQNKYVEAEDRYVAKHMEKKGREII